MHVIQTETLRNAAVAFSTANGAHISKLVEEKNLLLVLWLEFLSKYHRTGVADSLLDAASSSIRETAGLLSLGLVRPALFSLRGQIDLLLAWLYFKDHCVEWSYINDTGDGFKLKKELLQYLESHIPKFNQRFAVLRDLRSRKEADPYRLLSAHIHAQSTPVLPVVAELKDLVRTQEVCEECAGATFEVAEYLNDIFLVVFFPAWASLPSMIQTALTNRFISADQQKKAFFS